MSYCLSNTNNDICFCKKVTISNTVAHFQFCDLNVMLIVIAGGQLWTTLTSSLSNTFVTKVASTVKTFRTTVCTAASTSSHLLAMGNTPCQNKYKCFSFTSSG